MIESCFSKEELAVLEQAIDTYGWECGMKTEKLVLTRDLESMLSWKKKWGSERMDEYIIPAADVVEVRHGKWVWDENGMDWGLGAWTCSECHLKPETWWEADKGNPYRCAGSHYCPNCGAKMDGGDDDAADN